MNNKCLTVGEKKKKKKKMHLLVNPFDINNAVMLSQ